VTRAIEDEVGLPAALKWPNDVVVGHKGQWAKVCGILLEGRISPAQHLEHAILGIGINVNNAAEQLPAVERPVTSLALAAGRRLPRLPLLAAILDNLERQYEAAGRGHSPWKPWNERLITLGQRVAVHRVEQDAALLGIAEATDEWGQLLVRDDRGDLHAVMAADVTLQEAG
jgi:BirA family biotin operon repressor/biotin-[acetyl-CoA-carboxylase] ligase